MDINTIWSEFTEKLRSDSLDENDFADDMKPFLSGDAAKSRCEKFMNSPARMIDGEYKKIVILSCPDDEYRFDFLVNNGKWQLCFIEGITLPVSDINSFPYNSFSALPEKEAWINAERNISKIVYFFCKLKDAFGFDEALPWFNDGAGEFLCAKSWVPFYEGARAFIMYCCWIENRINGENVSIDIFSDVKCVICFTDHLWFKVYHAAGHIKTQLPLEEYKCLFEHIWRDRAVNSGWNVDFEYDGNDTVLSFYRHNIPERIK